MTQLTPMQTFEEKVKARLKETIADMLPDEALAGLVQKAVDEQFFKRRQIKDDYGRIKSESPSWFVQEVARLAEPLIKEHVAAAFAGRKSEIEDAIKQFVSDQNLMLIMFAYLSRQTEQSVYALGQEIAHAIRNR
jgi:hypothetical protein